MFSCCWYDAPEKADNAIGVRYLKRSSPYVRRHNSWTENQNVDHGNSQIDNYLLLIDLFLVTKNTHVVLNKNGKKVKDYIQVFEPYRETYMANNEHMTKVKQAYTNSSLEEFHKDIDKYRGMTEEFEAIPARATVRT